MNFQTLSNELTECDREPIHQIAQVQAFGALIGVDADWMITHVSTNCGQILGGIEPPKAGSALDTLFKADAITSLKGALGKLVEDDTVGRLFGLDLQGNGALFDCAIHPSGSTIIIELEPHADSEFRDHLAAINPIMGPLSAAKSTGELCTTAAKLVREMLGYDRVMIYRFLPDESGEVVAEEKGDNLESFLGLRYPKTDIPSQARELFVRNRFRIIPDAQCEPVAIEPSHLPDGSPLDLSMSVLRAPASVHVKYMANMGVNASLTISIVRQGQLWGLISCHHNEPKRVPYSLRSVAEMLSHMFSMTLDRLLVERSEDLRTRSQSLHEMLMRRMADNIAFTDEFETFVAALGNLIDQDGTSVLIQDVYQSVGAAPTHEQFLTLLPALGTAPESPVLAASALADQIPEAAAFSDVAAGALILPISRPPRDYLVMWRKPLSQTVRWAGNPEKSLPDGSGRLEPRSSFAAWAETIEGHSEEWSDSDLMIAENLRTTLLEVILRMTDEVASERKRMREQQDLLIAELNHRVRNILNLIRSLISQTTRDAASIADFTANIDGRIKALATAHDNITRQNWSPAPLASLFESEMEAYLSGKKDRLTISGEAVLVQPEAYTVLALVVHELVTNSAKYGSLCDSKGTIEVEVSRAGNGDLLISWIERGGPPVQPPTRKGFGSTIISRIIPHDLRGKAELNFKLSGLEAEFRVPARYIASNNSGDAVSGDQEDVDASGAGSLQRGEVPEHVLLVEDNMIIALDTEDTLLDAGVQSVSVESSVQGALASIKQREPDFAIVDFNLGSESSAKVTDELAARGVRFVLATGYSELGHDLEKLGAQGIMRKPYGAEAIQQALAGEAAQ